MYNTITRLLLLVIVHQSAQQETDILPEDVELVSSRDAATGKLATPFNNAYAYQPQVVLLHQPQLHGPSFRATATLVGDNAEGGPMGQITFTQYTLAQPVVVTINATGLPPGKHAIHIHAFGDLKEGCKSTGPHMANILIGNVEVKEDGILEINFHSPYLTLFGPHKGIVGRSIVIHEKPIEFNRFPDIHGYSVAPTVNDQQKQPEEIVVAGIIACGIITITNN